MGFRLGTYRRNGRLNLIGGETHRNQFTYRNTPLFTRELVNLPLYTRLTLLEVLVPCVPTPRRVSGICRGSHWSLLSPLAVSFKPGTKSPHRPGVPRPGPPPRYMTFLSSRILGYTSHPVDTSVLPGRVSLGTTTDDHRVPPLSEDGWMSDCET